MIYAPSSDILEQKVMLLFKLREYVAAGENVHRRCRSIVCPSMCSLDPSALSKMCVKGGNGMRIWRGTGIGGV